MPITLQELARLAGVSHTAVSLVLRGKHRGRVSEKKREKILALVLKYGYRPNVAAKGLVQGRTYRIAVCVEGSLAEHAIIGSFSLYERLGLLSQKIADLGYSITLVQTDTTRPAEEICRELSATAADGFVFLVWTHDVLDRVLFSLREKNIPAVAVGTTLNDHALTWTDVDRYEGFVHATSRLLDDGRSGIAMIKADPGSHWKTKEDAFLDTLRKRRHEDGRRRVFDAADASFAGAIAATDKALKTFDRLEGLLLTDNFFGEAVVLALRNHGREPGRDCRIVGFGDTILADRCSPRLSHYTLCIEEQVDFSIKALFDYIRSPADYQPRHEVLVPKYVEAQT